MSYALLYDSTKCVECGVCLTACKMKWDLPEGDLDRLGENTFTTLEVHDGHPVRRMCMHCNEPACASVCPVGALEKTPEGPVNYHPEKCIGCRYCMMACPFGVPKYEWSSAIPTVRKCVMCHDRVKEGKVPACTLPCRVGAMKFGDRDELLAEARERIRTSPDAYYPYIYGEKEAGGTGVLVIGAVAPEKLGLPMNIPLEPLPQKTWQVLSKLPGVVAVGASFCLGMWWLINRRDKIREEEFVMAKEEQAVATPAREVEEVLQ
jgi:formate dehydrogenase iron-sulfur subunit